MENQTQPWPERFGLTLCPAADVETAIAANALGVAVVFSAESAEYFGYQVWANFYGFLTSRQRSGSTGCERGWLRTGSKRERAMSALFCQHATRSSLLLRASEARPAGSCYTERDPQMCTGPRGRCLT